MCMCMLCFYDKQLSMQMWRYFLQLFTAIYFGSLHREATLSNVKDLFKAPVWWDQLWMERDCTTFSWLCLLSPWKSSYHRLVHQQPWVLHSGVHSKTVHCLFLSRHLSTLSSWTSVLPCFSRVCLLHVQPFLREPSHRFVKKDQKINTIFGRASKWRRFFILENEIWRGHISCQCWAWNGWKLSWGNPGNLCCNEKSGRDVQSLSSSKPIFYALLLDHPGLQLVPNCCRNTILE